MKGECFGIGGEGGARSERSKVGGSVRVRIGGKDNKTWVNLLEMSEDGCTFIMEFILLEMTGWNAKRDVANEHLIVLDRRSCPFFLTRGRTMKS